MLRYVRYAAAGFFALLAIAFVALWIRSHTIFDIVEYPASRKFALAIGTREGCFFCGGHGGSVPPRMIHESGMVGTGPTLIRPKSLLGFSRQSFDKSGFVTVPLWLIAVILTAAAYLGGIKRAWTFSPRESLVFAGFLAFMLTLGACGI